MSRIRDAAARARGIEAALLHGPGVAFVAIVGLLRLALSVLRVDEDLGAAGRRASPTWSGCCCSGGRGDDVLAALGLPRVVGLIRVVVGRAAEPHRRIERRQEADADADGRRDHDVARAVGPIPGAAAVVVRRAMIVIARVAARQRVVDVAARRIAAVVMVAAVDAHFGVPRIAAIRAMRVIGGRGSRHAQRQCDETIRIHRRSGFHVTSPCSRVLRGKRK